MGFPKAAITDAQVMRLIEADASSAAHSQW